MAGIGASVESSQEGRNGPKVSKEKMQCIRETERSILSVNP